MVVCRLHVAFVDRRTHILKPRGGFIFTKAKFLRHFRARKWEDEERFWLRRWWRIYDSQRSGGSLWSRSIVILIHKKFYNWTQVGMHFLLRWRVQLKISFVSRKTKWKSSDKSIHRPQTRIQIDCISWIIHQLLSSSLQTRIRRKRSFYILKVNKKNWLRKSSQLVGILNSIPRVLHASIHWK